MVPLGGESKSMFVSESLPTLVPKGLTSGTILSDTERISGCVCCGRGAREACGMSCTTKITGLEFTE